MPATHKFSPAATTTHTAPCCFPSRADAFAAVPDPRARHGRRFTLAALLANHLSARHRPRGAEPDAARKRAMGFNGVTPHQSTFARLFRRLDPAMLSAAITAHCATHPPPPPAGAVRYGITSLLTSVADASRLGALVRGHWQIENGRHDVKDVTMGEDRSLIHKGNGPSIMAILRDTVVSVLHRAGWRTIAERLRYYGGLPKEALAFLGISMAENA